MTQRKDRLALLEEMIASGNQDPFIRYARAMELRGRGDLDDALAAYREVISTNPEYVPSYLMAGQVAAELGHFDLARELLEAGIPRAQEAGDQRAVTELGAALEEI